MIGGIYQAISTSTQIDTSLHPYGWLESLTINGLSWPYTERIRPSVGDTLHWRIINASQRFHPMHLHGFYYDVVARGTMLHNDRYSRDARRTVVTETMTDRATMDMEWVVKRPGNWLFHCHLSFHVSPEIRLPGASKTDRKNHHQHMSGLVLGIEVGPGESDLISEGEPENLTLHANEDDSDPDKRVYSFGLEKSSNQPREPGPIILLKQYQTTYVTVKNHMSIPTSVHWHGLELDSWSDGVPGWSASDGLESPVIEPGDQFTYKLSLMRPGTNTDHIVCEAAVVQWTIIFRVRISF